MTAADAQLHIRYTGWASRLALDAALALSADDQTKARGVSHESILGTLGHIHFADRIWYKRTAEPDLAMPPTPDLSTLEALTGEWQSLQTKWQAWADAQTDESMSRIVVFKMLAGNTAEVSVTHIILHLVNHATLHRGQVVGMLRQLGVKPPNTDLIFYLRDLAIAAATTS